MKIELERVALYQEVWDRPFADICSKYRMSQSKLRAACRALGIPVPTERYWAKLATGQDAAKSPLLEEFDCYTYAYEQVKSHADFVEEEDLHWLENKLKWERARENLIAVVSPPTKWDPAIREVRKHLEAQAVRVNQQIAEYEARKLRPRNANRSWEPDWNNPSGPVEAGAFLVDKHSVTGFRVSPATFKRALSIANAIAMACRSRELKFEVLKTHGPIVISREAATITLALRERQEVAPLPKSVLSPSRHYLPTDKLALVISRHGGSDLQIVDSADFKVEDRLNEVFCCMWKQVVREKEEGRHRSYEQQEREEIAKIEEDIRGRLAAEHALKDAEDARKAALVADAESFATAERIRAYVQNASELVTDELHDLFSQWRMWALDVADAKDPTKALFKKLREGNHPS
ncbi:hypothetical protein [Rhodoferax bucti]|uniref:hypothetical protein n=1 Tax=Rhodoferax bucti TaxID=2576305 RepID=UPI0011091C37|nr:hypothetical protein [Rhodoferax bucti]